MTAAPFAVIAWLRNRRMRQFEEHLPEALDLLGRAVRAGHSFTTGLELIAQECAEPIAGEFRSTFEEQNLGLPLRDSLLNLADRVPIVDVRLLVTALLIQRDTGGNLAEILDELSRVIQRTVPHLSGSQRKDSSRETDGRDPDRAADLSCCSLWGS